MNQRLPPSLTAVHTRYWVLRAANLLLLFTYVSYHRRYELYVPRPVFRATDRRKRVGDPTKGFLNKKLFNQTNKIHWG